MLNQDQTALRGRYQRIEAQLAELFRKTSDPISRMATAAALLHHKHRHFFWTGFYRLVDEDLLVGPYQGALACQLLERGRGVCWAGIEGNQTLRVADVHSFPGHIPCDPRSQSEVVAPMRTPDGTVVGVLDVDSDRKDAFGEDDVEGLTRIAEMIYAP